LQYFISTHGARKGLADTALKTANAGYLTRRLVDVAQDVILMEEDCGTREGISVTALIEGGEIIQTLEERIIGRTVAETTQGPVNNDTVAARNTMIDDELAKKDLRVRHRQGQDSLGAYMPSKIGVWANATAAILRRRGHRDRRDYRHL